MGTLMLFLTAFIWGTAFLAQKLGADCLGPFAVTCFRSVFGFGFLLLCIVVRDCRSETTALSRVRRSLTVHSLRAGFFSGTSLFIASICQQIGIEHTTPGIAGFLTTNYMFFIPVLCTVGAFFLRLRGETAALPRWHVWTGVGIATVGSYLICMVNETMTLGRGEAWILSCAFLFAIQMLIANHFARTSDVLVMSATQLLTCMVLGAPFVLLPSELARIHGCTLFSARCLLPLFYLGVFSSGVAYTMQNFGQARTPPAVAGVILSMESVFAALSGYLVFGDRMSAAQFVGCGLVLCAVIFTQVLEVTSAQARRS